MNKAGDVVGTPDWQLDRMFETDTEEMLEKAYAEGIQIPVTSIASEFSRATYYLGLAVDHMIRAANDAEPFGKHKKIEALIEMMDDNIPFEMSQILKSLKEGA